MTWKDWDEGYRNDKISFDLKLTVPSIDWETVLPTLPALEKDFYYPHPDVACRSNEETDEILSANKIQIIRHGQNALSVPKPVTNMIEASFPEYITARLCDFLGGPLVAPTAVQKLMWPAALAGGDVLAIAPTGTGKTLGYLLPAIVHISAQEPLKPEDNSPIVLVVAPTRELVVQIMEQAAIYGSAITELGAQALVPLGIFGGVRKSDQKWQLDEKKPDFIVATLGRLMDFLNDGTLALNRVSYFVVDEVDRLIAADGKNGLITNDFKDGMRDISKLIRPDRQCLMVSATCSPDVMEIAKEFCGNEPLYFQVAESDQCEKLIVSANVEQTFISGCNSFWEKLQHLTETILPETFTESLSRTEQKMIVFVNSKKLVDKLTGALREAGWPAIGIHSDKVQEEREWIFRNFKDGTNNIMIATDVMGRGMDFEDVRCVVNFDLPTAIETYIHRVGRTGRIGKRIKKGYALSFVSTVDWEILPGLERMFIDCGLEVPPTLGEKISQQKNYGQHRYY